MVEVGARLEPPATNSQRIGDRLENPKGVTVGLVGTEAVAVEAAAGRRIPCAVDDVVGIRPEADLDPVRVR